MMGFDTRVTCRMLLFNCGRLFHVRGHGKPYTCHHRVIGMHGNGFTHLPAVGPGFERYFNLSAASGRDRLLGEKGAGAASTGLNLVNSEYAFPGILKCENIF